jgi:hypothetical protein
VTDVVVQLGFKLVTIELLNATGLPSRSYRNHLDRELKSRGEKLQTDALLSGWTADKDLHVNNVVALAARFRIKVGRSVKDEISRFELVM